MAKPIQSVYRTAKGAQIDMLKLINQNEMTIAVGNAKVNARGDKLGAGGRIVQKREEVVPAVKQNVAGTPKQVTQNVKPEVEDMDPEGNE